MDKPIDIEALECQHKEVTGGRHWYTVESPWRDESMPTYAVEGDEDPHAGTPVLDTVDVEEWADDADRQRKIAEADARLSLAVDCVNAIPALLAEIKHLRERVKAADELSAATREVHADGDQMVTAMGCPLCIAVVAYDATKGTP